MLLNAYNVKSFGAKGDATTDDTTSIQAAITAAGVDSKAVCFPAGTYKTTAELTSGTNGIHIVGAGWPLTRIRAGNTMRSVLALSSGDMRVKGIALDGGANADYACYGNSIAFSLFEDMHFCYALKDGMYCAGPEAGTPNNDSCTWLNCHFRNNGTVWQTAGNVAGGYAPCRTITVGGTVTTSAPGGGNPNYTVTGVGTTFTSIPIRRGDWMAIGVSPLVEFVQIQSVVSDTKIRLEDTTATINARSGQAYWIGQGDGYHEERHADNNINRIQGGLVRSNAGVGLGFHGLYGPRVQDVQVDVQPSYGIEVGNGMTGVVYHSYFDGVYFEACGAGAFSLGYAGGITINGTTETALSAARYDGQIISDAVPRWRIPDNARTYGVWLGVDGMIEIGGGQSTVPVTKSVDSAYFLVNGNLTLSAIAQTISTASDYIVPLRSNVQISMDAGDKTLTSTPSIAVSGHNYNGTIVLLSNISGSILTLQDNGTLAGSALILGTTTLAIGPSQVAMFVMLGNQWHYMSKSA